MYRRERFNIKKKKKDDCAARTNGMRGAIIYLGAQFIFYSHCSYPTFIQKRISRQKSGSIRKNSKKISIGYKKISIGIIRYFRFHLWIYPSSKGFTDVSKQNIIKLA